MSATLQRAVERRAARALAELGRGAAALSAVDITGLETAEETLAPLMEADARTGAPAIWNEVGAAAIGLRQAILAVALEGTGARASLDATGALGSALLDPLARLEDARPALFTCAAADATLAVQAPTAAHRELIAACTSTSDLDWRAAVRAWAWPQPADTAAQELQDWGVPAFAAPIEPAAGTPIDERPTPAGPGRDHPGAPPADPRRPPADPRRPPADPRRPLAGATVVELGGLWAAPYATQLLRELGATVVKVEAPMRPDGARAGSRAHYAALNAGKRELRLDLRRPAEREQLLELLGPSTLIVENFSARVLPNLGLDPALLLSRGASLVRLPASRRRPQWRGLGSVIEIGAGLGRPAGDGALTCAPIPFTDPLSGLSAALHGVAALRGVPGMSIIGQLEDVAAPLARQVRRRAEPVR